VIPDLDRARWAALSPYLDEALDLPRDGRTVWLERLRSRDAALAGELEALLAEHDRVEEDGFLQQGPPPLSTLAGQTLGAYTLRAPIGHGGMGSVWLAERSDGRYEGTVAVKLLNASLIGQEAESRFRREGRFLARLRHRHIAHLIDAGVSPAAQPYLVLEHVDGEPLDVYCDRGRLGVEARVRLFLDVLAAVSHAHANLIVHRDLKPSNVLVDRAGTVKLVDFGVAKLVVPDADAGPATLTLQGESALTPGYAAPEQIEGGHVTTATDVYALGVLLYVVLSGRHPAGEITHASPGALMRATLEREPERLSAAATAETEDGSRADRAADRSTTAEALGRTLRGDLDTIVAKALKKDPAERYASVEALAEDLRRYLDHAPISARRDSFSYRAAKFVRRQRLALATAAAIVAALAGGLSVALVQRSRARAAQARAEAETRKALAVKEYLVSVFDMADPYAPPNRSGADVTARDLLERGAARIDVALAGQPDVQGELAGVLGRVHANLGLVDKARPLLQRSLDQRRAEYGPRHPAVAEAMAQLGDLLTSQNRYAEAEPLLREALAQRREFLGDRNAATAASVDRLASHLRQRNDYAAAEPLFREALAMRRAVLGPDHREVSKSLNNLALLLFLKGRLDEAEPLYREALAITVRQLGEDHLHTAGTTQNLANVLEQRGRIVEAEALYRRALAIQRKALGDVHPNVSLALNNFGAMLRRENRTEEAEILTREALAIDRQIFGEHHDFTAESVRNLGEILRQKGEFDEAERMFRQALATNRSIFGAQHTRVAVNLGALAATLQLKGDLGQALPLFRDAREQYRQLAGENHWRFVAASVALARAVLEDGDATEAERIVRPLDRGDPSDRKRSLAFLEGQAVLGRALARQGRGTEALSVVEAALPESLKAFPPGDWRIGEMRLAQGEALAASGSLVEAAPVLRQARALLRVHQRAQPQLAAQAEAALTRLARARASLSIRTPPRSTMTAAVTLEVTTMATS
jgi:serine/threonine protein kinase/Flp pilus assembly protein TadD